MRAPRATEPQNMQIAAKENKAGESIAQEGTQERRQDAAACSAAVCQ